MLSGWSVTVCNETTEATRVTIQSGPSKDDNEVWWEWKREEGRDHDYKRLPDGQQGLNRIYLKAINPQEKQVNLCVKYDDVQVKHYDFDGKDEDHEMSVGDRDGDCKC